MNTFRTFRVGLIATVLLAFSSSALLRADQPLKSALGLSMDQARVVDDIQKSYQKSYVHKRSEYLTQMRVVRRARIANDSAGTARETEVARRLHEEWRAVQAREDADIRKTLTPEQNRKFDDYLKLRREMVGSSRDDKEFTGR
jgi:hypothetical protein